MKDFRKGSIIRRFRFKEFQNIPKKPGLIDLVAVQDFPREREILRTWEKHLKAIKVPFVITRQKKQGKIATLTLWKERRC